MIIAGSGQSLRTDPRAALSEALEEAKGHVGESKTVAAFIFITSHHLHAFPELLQILRNQIHPRAVMGATGSGIIGPQGEVENAPGISILLLSSERLTAAAAIIPNPESSDAVEHLRGEIPSLYRETGLLVVSVNPHYLNPAFFQRLADRLPETPVVGAAAGWCTQDQQSLIAADTDVSDRGCAAMHLAGCIEPVIGVAQAVLPETRPRTITHCKGNIIMTIDSEPAADVLATFIQAVREESTGSLRENFFCILGHSASDFEAGRYIVRNILAVEPSSKQISVAETVHPGLFISFGLKIPAGARRSFREMLERQSRSLTARVPRAAIIFNCCARGQSLYSKSHVDIDAFHEFFPDLPVAGYFGFSEIGPILWDGKTLKSAILNYTAVLTLITEPMEMLGTS